MKTSEFYSRSLRLLMALTLGLLLIAGLGCQPGAAVDEPEANGPAAEVTPTPESSRTPTRVAAAPTSTATTASEEGAFILTFWTVEPVSDLAGDELATFFTSKILGFERTADVNVDVLIKKGSGKGGVLDFLRTAREVAPSILPDVVVMNATDLNQAYTDGLIQPLDGRLDRSIIQDLLPAARRMGTVDERLVGVPIGLEMEHTVYHTQVFTETPLVWQDVLSKNTQYLFPAKGVNGLVNDFTLSQYFSAGGDFLNDQSLPRLNERVLGDVLEVYQQARENGLIDATLLEVATPEEVWPRYVQGEAGLAQVSVRQYLTDREALVNTSFSPMPVLSQGNAPVPVMRGWVLVLTTSDIRRQDAALRLMETFLSTTNNAEWNRINKSIPIRDTAYREMAGDDPYWTFLLNQLNAARPEPRFPQYDRIGRIMQQAVEQVIRGEATAEEATETAIDALAQ